MTKKQIADQVNAIKKVVAEIGGDKNKAKQFLLDAGIIKDKKRNDNMKNKLKRKRK